MLQESYISDKKISKSMTKLNRVSSDNRFRVKSLRMKTQQKQSSGQSPVKKLTNFPSLLKMDSVLFQSPVKRHATSLNADMQAVLINSKLRVKSSFLQKDYQNQLTTKLDVPKNVLQEIFRLKLQSENIKLNHQKYFQFCKMMYLRINGKVQVSLEGFNLKSKALQRFLEFYLEWKSKNIVGLDLSLCSELARQVKTKQQEEEQTINSKSNKTITLQSQSQQLWPMNSIMTRLILEDRRLTKLSVRNMHINPQQMIDLLTQCLRSKRIYSLDISNKTSQSINRLGNQYYYLQAFFAKNQHVAVVKMDNLNITDQCVEKITNGILRTSADNPLKILSLTGNILTSKSINPIYNLMTRAGLVQLHLSHNPLGKQFFVQLKTLRTNSIKWLDLSATNMDSESLFHFLGQLCQNKSLQILKLDQNNFSHHWFHKIKDLFQNGLSIHSLSMVDCSIKNFDHLFQGITHSKHLKRLNLNFNLVDIENQIVEKVASCLKNNKVLQQLRMRFCGYKERMLCQLMQALTSNHTLQVMDISENQMSDQGGKSVLKLLSQNNSLKQIGIEKLQFTVKMSESIQKSLNYNREVKQKADFNQLINTNKVYKSKDTMSWTDIEKLSEQAKRIEKYVSESRGRNQKIEQRIVHKKQYLVQLKKQCKQVEKRLDGEIKRQEQKLSSLVRRLRGQIQSVEQKEGQALGALEIEQNLIKALEQKIAKENDKIRKRQHQLEEQLRDEKYLQRKKDNRDKEQVDLKHSSKGEVQRTARTKKSGQIFDNTKGLTSLSKRKGSSISKQP